MESQNQEEVRHSFKFSLFISIFFMGIAWFVFFLERIFDLNLSNYGLLPRDITHLYGIITMPFIHGNFEHIISNSVAFIPLSFLLFYFFPKKSHLIFLILFFSSGFFTWIIGRNTSYHVGMSALIYALATYIFVSGIKSKNRKLITVALIVVVVNGGMVWGVLPSDPTISWEGHLSGMISGLVLAFIIAAPKEKSKIPDRTMPIYTTFEMNDFDSTENEDVKIVYYYKNKINSPTKTILEKGKKALEKKMKKRR